MMKFLNHAIRNWRGVSAKSRNDDEKGRRMKNANDELAVERETGGGGN